MNYKYINSLYNCYNKNEYELFHLCFHDDNQFYYPSYLGEYNPEIGYGDLIKC